MSVPEVKLCAGAWGFRQYELPAYFEAAASLGLKYVEVNVSSNPAVKHLKPLLSEDDVRKMLDAAERAGVRVVAFALSNDFTIRDAKRLRTQMEQLKRCVEMGALAGVEVCRVFAGFGPARHHIPSEIYNQVADQPWP